MRLAVVFAVLGLLVASAPAAAFDDATLARRTYENVILPGYARFDDTAHRLAEASDALCSIPSPEALAATRAAARDALVAWGRIEPVRFGPIVQNQRSDRLLFYPDQHGIVGRQTARLLVKRDDADIEPAKLAGASVAVQGFGALDVALYGQGSEQLATPDAAFRCRYVRALALDIAQIAGDVLAEWKGEYGRTWLHPGPGNKTYLVPTEPTQALFRSYVTQLEVLRLHRLAVLDGSNAKPAGPLLPQSHLALPFVLAGIEGARDILAGFTADDLAADEAERDAVAMLGSVAADLGFALRAGEAAATMAPNAFTDPAARTRLTPMLLSLKNAEDLGRAALGALTGQTLGFNSLDGD